jgi:hypothetical protein
MHMTAESRRVIVVRGWRDGDDLPAAGADGG